MPTSEDVAEVPFQVGCPHAVTVPDEVFVLLWIVADAHPLDVFFYVGFELPLLGFRFCGLGCV